MTNWEKRAENRKHSTSILKKNGIQFESFNNGAHLKIGEIDFWPGTGLWKAPDADGYGVNILIDYIREKEKLLMVMNESSCEVYKCPKCGSVMGKVK